MFARKGVVQAIYAVGVLVIVGLGFLAAGRMYWDWAISIETLTAEFIGLSFVGALALWKLPGITVREAAEMGAILVYGFQLAYVIITSHPSTGLLALAIAGVVTFVIFLVRESTYYVPEGEKFSWLEFFGTTVEDIRYRLYRDLSRILYGRNR